MLMRWQRFFSLLAWASLGFIAFATLSPYSLRPELTDTEPGIVVVFERIAAFGVLGLFFLLSYPDRCRTVCLIVFGSAVAFELGQAILPDRHARFIDLLEKFVGGGVGILLGFALIPVLIGPGGIVSKIDRLWFDQHARKLDDEMRELTIGFFVIILFALGLVAFQKLNP